MEGAPCKGAELGIGGATQSSIIVLLFLHSTNIDQRKEKGGYHKKKIAKD